MKKTWLYALIALVIIGMTGCAFNDQKTEGDKKDETKIAETDVQNKLYPLLKSTNKSRVYKNDKVTAEKLTDEQKILGTITYIILNHKDEITKKGNDTFVSFGTIEKYASKLYGTELKIENAKADTLFNIHSQTSFVTADKKEKVYKFNFDFLEDDAEPKDLLDKYLDSDVIFTRAEIDGDKAFVYDKIIVNGDFNFSSNTIATIAKLDGSDKKELNDFETIEKVYEQYSDYFTEFKHTFKINEDKTYTYVTSEPIK